MTLPTFSPLTLCLLIFLGISLYMSPGLTQEDKEQPPVEDIEQSSSGTVTIEGSKKELISEFRINGQLYMIRITPKKGKPYYLVDSDGDGNLETRWNELAPDLLIPSWVLISW